MCAVQCVCGVVCVCLCAVCLRKERKSLQGKGVLSLLHLPPSPLFSQEPPELLLGPAVTPRGQGQAFIQYADSIEGPFTAFNNNTGIFVNWWGRAGRGEG